jgi:hypothetical protein
MPRQEMNIQGLLVVKAIWLLLATCIFLLTLDLYDGTANTRDAELILIYGMLALYFPASQFVVLAIGLFGHLTVAMGWGLTIPTTYLTLTIEWIIFVICGYLQWFVLLPWVWRRWKTWRAGINSPRHK